MNPAIAHAALSTGSRHLQSLEEGLWGVLGALASVVTAYSHKGGSV